MPSSKRLLSSKATSLAISKEDLTPKLNDEVTHSPPARLELDVQLALSPTSVSDAPTSVSEAPISVSEAPISVSKAPTSVSEAHVASAASTSSRSFLTSSVHEPGSLLSRADPLPEMRNRPINCDDYQPHIRTMSTAAEMSTPDIDKRASSALTPGATKRKVTAWASLATNFVWIKHSGSRQKKFYVNKTGERNDWLFVIEGVNGLGNKVLFQLWGDRPTELMSQFFQRAVDTNGHHLFLLHDPSSIEDEDGSKLIFIKGEPNEWQQQYSAVYKLTTKGKYSRQPQLVPESIPDMVSWEEDAYFLADGRPVPHPSTWGEPTLDESKIVFADLFEVKPSPGAKKPRTGDAL